MISDLGEIPNAGWTKEHSVISTKANEENIFRQLDRMRCCTSVDKNYV